MSIKNGSFWHEEVNTNIQNRTILKQTAHTDLTILWNSWSTIITYKAVTLYNTETP